MVIHWVCGEVIDEKNRLAMVYGVEGQGLGSWAEMLPLGKQVEEWSGIVRLRVPHEQLYGVEGALPLTCIACRSGEHCRQPPHDKLFSYEWTFGETRYESEATGITQII